MALSPFLQGPFVGGGEGKELCQPKTRHYLCLRKRAVLSLEILPLEYCCEHLICRQPTISSQQYNVPTFQSTPQIQLNSPPQTCAVKSFSVLENMDLRKSSTQRNSAPTTLAIKENVSALLQSAIKQSSTHRPFAKRVPSASKGALHLTAILP